MQYCNASLLKYFKFTIESNTNKNLKQYYKNNMQKLRLRKTANASKNLLQANQHPAQPFSFLFFNKRNRNCIKNSKLQKLAFSLLVVYFKVLQIKAN